VALGPESLGPEAQAPMNKEQRANNKIVVKKNVFFIFFSLKKYLTALCAVIPKVS
jgi:hypothetical protein